MLERLKLMAEGDQMPAGGGTPPPAPAWYAPAESLRTEAPDVWQSFEKGVQSGNHKDLPTLIKHTIGLEKKLGSALSMPQKENQAEVSAFLSKVRQAGLLPSPPESADKYELDLSAIPEALRSDNTVNAVRAWAHKHGLSNDAVKELVGIEAARFSETVKPALEYDTSKALAEFNEWAESQGKTADAMAAYSGMWLSKNVSEQELQTLERAGLANHPALLKLVAKAALDTGEDISLIVQGSGMSADAESSQKEALDIINNKDNPLYKDYWAGKQMAIDRVSALMAKAYPGHAEL